MAVSRFYLNSSEPRGNRGDREKVEKQSLMRRKTEFGQPERVGVPPQGAEGTGLKGGGGPGGPLNVVGSALWGAGPP